MQRVTQDLEQVDPGLWKHADRLGYRLVAVALTFACVAGVLSAL